MYTFAASIPETSNGSESERCGKPHSPKASPGPWSYELINKFWFAVKDSEGKVISSVWHEREADAVLISNAPQMLKILKRVRSELDNLFYASEVEGVNPYGPNEALMGDVSDLISHVSNLSMAMAERLEREAAEYWQSQISAAELEAAAAKSDPNLSAFVETWKADVDSAWSEYLRITADQDYTDYQESKAAAAELEAHLIDEEHPTQADDSLDFGD